MLYRTDPQRRPSKRFIEPYTKCEVWYFSKKELSALYRDKNFNVIGEIGGSAHVPNQGDVLIVESGKEIPILPRGSLIRPFERIIGYAALENDSYLAVVWSLFPSFLRRRQNMA